MSKKGGYTIIDLKDTPITTDTEVTIDGIYEEIESNFRKATLFSGIVLDDVELSDRFVALSVSGTSFVGILDTYIDSGAVQHHIITIASDDGVTITNDET